LENLYLNHGASNVPSPLDWLCYIQEGRANKNNVDLIQSKNRLNFFSFLQKK